MDPAEVSLVEAKIVQMTTAITDDRGELRPIEEISFEILAGQIRWTVWSRPTPREPRRRLQSLTTRIDDIDGLLEASKLLLQIAVADQVKASAGIAGDYKHEEN